MNARFFCFAVIAVALAGCGDLATQRSEAAAELVRQEYARLGGPDLDTGRVEEWVQAHRGPEIAKLGQQCTDLLQRPRGGRKHGGVDRLCVAIAWYGTDKPKPQSPAVPFKDPIEVINGMGRK